MQMSSYFVHLNKLDKSPAFDELAFEDNVDYLLRLLTGRVEAGKVAIVTIPPIGEHMDSELNMKVGPFSLASFVRWLPPNFSIDECVISPPFLSLVGIHFFTCAGYERTERYVIQSMCGHTWVHEGARVCAPASDRQACAMVTLLFAGTW